MCAENLKIAFTIFPGNVKCCEGCQQNVKSVSALADKGRETFGKDVVVSHELTAQLNLSS